MRAILFSLLVALLILPFITIGVQADVEVEGTVDSEFRSVPVGSQTDDQVVEREEQAMTVDGLSIAELKALREAGESHQFQAEVDQLMNIIINSLYSNDDVFLRELVSNASDALDKLRFLAVGNPELLEELSQLDIRIKADPESRTLSIRDTGIGMTKADLVGKLGTIAKSGTKEFLQTLASTGDSNLIGQFGVGFYSAYLVADTVTVITKNAEDEQYIWESNASGSYTVVKDPRGNTLGRGTNIILSLKEEAMDLLKPERLETLIKQYSEFIAFPIYLWKSHEASKEVPLTAEELADLEEEEDDEVEYEDETETEEEKEEKPKTKTVTETVWSWDLQNDNKPLWLKNPSDIEDEEYNTFYKTISKDSQDPLIHTHFKAEGDVNFKAILYVPSKAPFGNFEEQMRKGSGSLRLYVKKVFITDDFYDVMPKYLGFIRGVCDSDDIDLNVSREMLQQSKSLKTIKKRLVRKSIAMFQELEKAEDQTDFNTFFENFGANIKYGIIEDTSNRDRLSKLLRFFSSASGEEKTSLSKYVENMKKGQEDIYYIGATNKEVAASSPFVESLIRRGYEVLYLVEAIDEYTVQHLAKFDGHKLVDVTKEGSVDFAEEADEETEEEYTTLVEFLTAELKDQVAKVKVTNRLTTSPSALVSGSYGMSANMQRIMKAQAMGGNNPYANFSPKPTLELNPHHPIIRELNSRVKADAEDETVKATALLMYETAALHSGYTLDNPAEFASRIQRMLKVSLGIDADAEADVPEYVEPEVEAEEEFEYEEEEEYKTEL